MLQVENNSVVERFTANVMRRVFHHFKRAQNLLPYLIGLVTLYGEEVQFYRDGQGNLSSFKSRQTGKRYAITREPNKGTKVAIRQNNSAGPVLYLWDDEDMRRDGGNAIHSVFRVM